MEPAEARKAEQAAPLAGPAELLGPLGRPAPIRPVAAPPDDRAVDGGAGPGAGLAGEDDGRGFEADDEAASADDVRAVAAAGPPGRPRLGLLGMKERAELLGGTFAIESSPGGGGTTVFVRLPLGPSTNQPTEDDDD